jgi:release factor glutamine methyltransferase
MLKLPLSLHLEISNKLGENLGTAEGEAQSKLLLEHFFGITSIKLFRNTETDFPETRLSNLEQAIDRLLNDEPIQHIIGQSFFYNHYFEVGPGALIPRPETEELVDLIVKEHSQSSDLHVLDIGTGTGCIAISLALALQAPHVAAIDISSAALSIATKNAQQLMADVDFSEVDILKSDLDLPKNFDIIVSNPPYIKQSEAAQMERNVLDFEPHEALFVADNNPLIFYKRISELAYQSLKKGGKLYFEINEHLGQETLSEVLNAGFENAVLIKDMQGKDRMIKAEKGR